MQMLVDFVQVPERFHFVLDRTNRGSSDIEASLVEKSHIFEGPRDGADATIIVGEPDSNGQAPLLLMRFHHVPSACKMSDTDQIALFNNLMARCGKKGFDVTRKGGSSGPVRCDNHLLNFLKQKNVFPRPSRFVKLINHGDQWECVYITPYHRDTDKESRKREIWNILHPDAPIDEKHPFRAAVAFCAPPWPGGQVEMSPELVTKCPFLLWFAKVKLQSAHIIKYLNA